MTNEKLYARLLALKKLMDKDQEQLVDKLITENRNLCSGFAFAPDFAALILDVKNDIRESQAAGNGKKEQYKALEDILKDARGGTQEKLYNAYMCAGHQNFCDGHRLVRLNNPLDFAMPPVVDPFDPTRIMQLRARNPLELPDLKSLKAYIKIHKIEAKADKVKGVKYSFGTVEVNAIFLATMMEALPGANAYHDGSPTNGIYFESDDGDGLLLPLRPDKTAGVSPKTEL